MHIQCLKSSNPLRQPYCSLDIKVNINVVVNSSIHVYGIPPSTSSSLQVIFSMHHFICGISFLHFTASTSSCSFSSLFSRFTSSCSHTSPRHYLSSLSPSITPPPIIHCTLTTHFFHKSLHPSSAAPSGLLFEEPTRSGLRPTLIIDFPVVIFPFRRLFCGEWVACYRLSWRLVSFFYQ